MTKYRFEDIAYNSTEKKKPVEEDKYTYIGLEHLDPQCLDVTRFGSEVAPIGEKLIMKKGDVLFGKRRAYQKKVAIAPFDGIFSAHGMVLRFPVFPESHCQTGPHSRLPHSGGGEIFTGSTILLMIFLPED